MYIQFADYLQMYFGLVVACTFVFFCLKTIFN